MEGRMTTSERGRIEGGSPREVAEAVHALAESRSRSRLTPADFERIADALRRLRDPGRQIVLVHDYLSLLPRREQPAALCELIRDGSVYEREAGLEHAERIGPAALGPLGELTAHRNVTVRWHAYEAIRRIGGVATIPYLIAGLSDEDTGIRWVASHGLEAIGEPAFLEVVRAIVNLDASIPFHNAARRVLMKTRPPQPDAEIAALIDSLAHWTTTTESKGRAVELLQAMRESARPARRRRGGT
jgi:HEAT repeat protein